MKSETRKGVLCADDYGISPAVNRGINLLAKNRRISATSIMVCFDDWKKGAETLIQFRDHLDIGLHFVLTDFSPLFSSSGLKTLANVRGDFFSVGRLIQKTLLGQIDEAEVLKELRAQYESFSDYFGFEPDYIDGHHNVHQFPGVRNAVLKFLIEDKNRRFQYVRNTAISPKDIFRQKADFLKSGFISLWGYEFYKLAQSARLPTNSSFSGVYGLDRFSKFGEKMKLFLAASADMNGIIMTHPGIPDDTLARRDIFFEGRQFEYDYLMSPAFQEVLENFNFRLTRFMNPVYKSTVSK